MAVSSGKIQNNERIDSQIIRPIPVLRFLHRVYKFIFPPLFGECCRFEPSCSCYCIQAIEKHGIFKGSMLASWRVIRCNPWCKGGSDPVP